MPEAKLRELWAALNMHADAVAHVEHALELANEVRDQEKRIIGRHPA